MSRSLHEAVNTLVEEGRCRPIVPFVGAGISVASGFPSIREINHYLAKVDFAIERGVFRHRYPHPESERWYRDHPSQFLSHFGWPDIGQLDFDLWQWLLETEDVDSRPALVNLDSIRNHVPRGGDKPRRSLKEPIRDDLAYDLTSVEDDSGKVHDLKLDQRDFLTAIVQYHLRRDLERVENNSDDAALRQWKRFKQWYRGELHSHTHHSDASWPVQDLVNAARQKGLDFITLTEHNTISPELT